MNLVSRVAPWVVVIVSWELTAGAGCGAKATDGVAEVEPEEELDLPCKSDLCAAPTVTWNTEKHILVEGWRGGCRLNFDGTDFKGGFLGRHVDVGPYVLMDWSGNMTYPYRQDPGAYFYRANSSEVASSSEVANAPGVRVISDIVDAAALTYTDHSTDPAYPGDFVVYHHEGLGVYIGVRVDELSYQRLPGTRADCCHNNSGRFTLYLDHNGRGDFSEFEE